jgi:hypothetical protein
MSRTTARDTRMREAGELRASPQVGNRVPRKACEIEGPEAPLCPLNSNVAPFATELASPSQSTAALACAS